MTCGRRRPVYDTKGAAQRHGAITYGHGDYRVRHVKGGWSAYED